MLGGGTCFSMQRSHARATANEYPKIREHIHHTGGVDAKEVIWPHWAAWRTTPRHATAGTGMKGMARDLTADTDGDSSRVARSGGVVARW
jgi:hypothetical protein